MMDARQHRRVSLHGATLSALLAVISVAQAARVAADDTVSNAHATRAAQQLRREIAEAILQGRAAPIQSTLARHQAHGAGIALKFPPANQEHTKPPVTRAEFPAMARPAQMTPGEWSAFRTRWRDGGLNLESENGSVSMQLLDLDEDGRRDLIIERYVGGTGLFTEVDVYRHTAAGQFEAPSAGAEPVYSINGRGADQAATWVRLGGKVFLAYREGRYGSDTLSLRRAFAPADANRPVPTIEVRYRYLHRVAPDDLQKPERATDAAPSPLSPASRQAISATLAALSRAQQRNQPFQNRCTANPAKSAQLNDDELATWLGAGHYTFEIVARFWVNGRAGSQPVCHAAQLIRFNSSYLRSAENCCALWLAKTADSSETEQVPLTSRRIATGVTLNAPAPASR